MHTIEQIFINGEFVTPHGTEWFDLYNPATAQVIGRFVWRMRLTRSAPLRRRKRRFRRGRRPQSRNASRR
jgi:acyl-CoA reductase-like NAD-dependent aldehyde dehydrogenase